MQIKRILASGVLALALLSPIGLGGCANINTPQGQAQATQAMQYGLIAADAANAMVSFKKELTASETALQANKDKFSPADWAQLQTTDQDLHGVVDTIESLQQAKTQTAAGAGATLLISASQVLSVYGHVKASYLTAKQIIEPKLGTLTPLQQYDLQQLDQSAKALDAAMNQIKGAAPNTNLTPLILNAIQLATLTLKVAVAAGA